MAKNTRKTLRSKHPKLNVSDWEVVRLPRVTTARPVAPRWPAFRVGPWEPVTVVRLPVAA